MSSIRPGPRAKPCESADYRIAAAARLTPRADFSASVLAKTRTGSSEKRQRKHNDWSILERISVTSGSARFPK
jgi:hypothetical protein